MKKNSRIAARVAPSTAELLAELARQEGISRSELIERALQLYGIKKKQVPGKELYKELLKSGFIGGCSIDEPLSLNYKEEFTKSLNSKYKC